MDNINKLIEKYDNAETSLEEEAFLKEYFQHNIIPPHLMEYKQMFVYFNNSKQEVSSKPITLKVRSYKKVRWLSIAASIMLMIGMYTNKMIEEQNRVNFLYSQTKSALMMLGNNINKGSAAVGVSLNEFQKVQNKILNN